MSSRSIDVPKSRGRVLDTTRAEALGNSRYCSAAPSSAVEVEPEGGSANLTPAHSLELPPAAGSPLSLGLLSALLLQSGAARSACRRLAVRYERLPEIHEAFLMIGRALIRWTSSSRRFERRSY